MFGKKTDPVIRLCAKCNYFTGDGKCGHPNNTRINLVTGYREYIESPDLLRNGTWVSAGNCGEHGKWWEPRV